jgi:hypothetical protein
MLSKQTSFLSLMIGLLVTLFLGLSAWSASSAMFAKAKEQDKTLEDFRHWRSTYEALIPIQKQWNQAFQSAGDARDLLSLHRLMGSSLKTNMDRLVVEKIDRLKVSELELGLSRVCFSSIGESGLSFEGESFSSLVSELKKMAARNDIEMGRVKVLEQKSKPTAMVQGFCLLLKD